MIKRFFLIAFCVFTLPSCSSSDRPYRGFLVDEKLPFKGTVVHYNIFVPEKYDGLYVTLPGYGSYYFQGVGVNLERESAAYEVQKNYPNLIILAPQLTSWDENSADQTIELVKYISQKYEIPSSRVFISGYSGGGETLSIFISKAPELFSRALILSSEFDGNIENVVNVKLPLMMVIGENDEYYSSEPFYSAYASFCTLYQNKGLDESEIDCLIKLDVKKHEYFTSRNVSNEHAGGDLFYKDKAIMSWLLNG